MPILASHHDKGLNAMSIPRQLLTLPWLLPLPVLATGIELDFIGPELTGVYQVYDGKAQGELVGMLQQLGSQAGIQWRYRLATPARVEVTLGSQQNVCSLHLQSRRQRSDYQVIGILGEHAIVAYSGMHDRIGLDELAQLPASQRLGFGSGLKSLLQRQGLNVIEHPSLATAVQLVGLGRARVLLTTQISMYSLQPAPLLRRIGTLGKADNVLACSRQLPPGVAARLRQALSRLLIPFTL